MQALRYPELRNVEDLPRVWPSLIRALELRDTSQSFVDVNGVVVKPIADYTLKDNDGIVLGDASDGSFDVYLPSAKRFTSRMIRFKAKYGTFRVVAQGTQTIDGMDFITITSTTLVTLLSDGENWIIL